MARFIVTIVDKKSGKELREHAFAGTAAQAARAVVGTPMVLGRYAHHAYNVLSVEEVPEDPCPSYQRGVALPEEVPSNGETKDGSNG
jgi:hypothetical protein